MHGAKTIVLFGSTTNTSGETISENTTNSAGYGPSWSESKMGFDAMDVVLNVTALTGTSPTITFSIQELFSDVWVETAKSTAVSATGAYILCAKTLPNTAASKNQGAFPALGRGTDKRVVTTIGGTTSAVTASIYFAFHRGE